MTKKQIAKVVRPAGVTKVAPEVEKVRDLIRDILERLERIEGADFERKETARITKTLWPAKRKPT